MAPLVDPTETVILEDVFYMYPSLAIPYRLHLTEKSLYVKSLTKSKSDLDDIPIKDVIGCHVLQGRTDKTKLSECEETAAYLCIYSYPLKGGGGLLNRQLRRERSACTFQMRKFRTCEENTIIVHKWRTAILWLLRGVQLVTNGEARIPKTPPVLHKLLILVNPHSGPGKAYQIFKERVVPLLAESDTQYQLIVTDRANCARDFVRKADLAEWNGIVVVSGDGLLYEVFNGLMERPDWKTAVKIPVGVIPGGSGNGLARAISYATGEPYDPNVVISSVLNVVRGRVAPMDLVKVQTAAAPVYSFLSVGWGLMADIDIESERLRAIGEARFAVWAVVRALGLRKYKGRLSYLPVAGYESHMNMKSATDECKMERSKTLDNHLKWCNEELVDDVPEQLIFRSKSFGARTSDVYDDDNKIVCLTNFTYHKELSNLQMSNESGYSTVESQIDSNNHDKTSHSASAEDTMASSETISLNPDVCTDLNVNRSNAEDFVKEEYADSFMQPLSTSPPLDQPVPDDWVVIDDEFVLVYVSHQTHLSSDVLFAPDAKLDDGIMWLVVIRAGVTRAQVLNFLASLQTGSHVHIPYVDVIPIHAFRLEPSQSDGFLTVDGEVIPCGSIQAEVLPSFARVMTR